MAIPERARSFAKRVDRPCGMVRAALGYRAAFSFFSVSSASDQCQERVFAVSTGCSLALPHVHLCSLLSLFSRSNTARRFGLAPHFDAPATVS